MENQMECHGAHGFKLWHILAAFAFGAALTAVVAYGTVGLQGRVGGVPPLQQPPAASSQVTATSINSKLDTIIELVQDSCGVTSGGGGGSISDRLDDDGQGGSSKKGSDDDDQDGQAMEVGDGVNLVGF